MHRAARLKEVIKASRKKQDWTQDELAQRAGCSRSLIAAIEVGQQPTRPMLQRLVGAFPQAEQQALLETVEAREILHTPLGEPGADTDEYQDDDMIKRFMNLRRTEDVDLSGKWNAMWLTTTNGEENRNRETIRFQRRWNGTWELANETVSDDNPDGGYLWVARMELFDNKHLLGYYCARERSILAKGTLCLELQPNGREILGVWDGLNFDTMWATGSVALCRVGERTADPGVVLDRFTRSRPKMPY